MVSLYERHKQKWSVCNKCSLHENRTKVVLARGRIPCEVLFIGEAPGASEDVIGQPFVGPAGHLLENSIIKPTLGDNWSYALTNLVGCIPIGEEGAKADEPPKEAIVACRPRLVELVDMCQPRLLVLVGTLARKHGIIEASDTPFIYIIHPAAILRMDLSQRGLAIQRCCVDLEMALSSVVPF